MNHEQRESASYRRHLSSPCCFFAAWSKTDFVAVFPLIILEKRDRGRERRGELGMDERQKQVVVRRNATHSKEWDARSGILYRERRRKPLFFLRCRLSSRNTSGVPKRDENSGELLVRFPQVSLVLSLLTPLHAFFSFLLHIHLLPFNCLPYCLLFLVVFVPFFFLCMEINYFWILFRATPF